MSARSPQIARDLFFLRAECAYMCGNDRVKSDVRADLPEGLKRQVNRYFSAD